VHKGRHKAHCFSGFLKITHSQHPYHAIKISKLVGIRGLNNYRVNKVPRISVQMLTATLSNMQL